MQDPNLSPDDHKDLKFKHDYEVDKLPKTKDMLRHKLNELESSKAKWETRLEEEKKQEKELGEKLKVEKEKQAQIETKRKALKNKEQELTLQMEKLEETLVGLSDEISRTQEQNVVDQKRELAEEMWKLKLEMDALPTPDDEAAHQKALTEQQDVVSMTKLMLDEDKDGIEKLEAEIAGQLAQIYRQQRKQLMGKTYNTYCPPENLDFEDPFYIFTKKNSNDPRHLDWEFLAKEKKEIFAYWNSAGTAFSERSMLIFPNCRYKHTRYSAYANQQAVLPKKDLEMCWRIMEAATQAESVASEDSDNILVILRKMFKDPENTEAKRSKILQMIYTFFLRYVMFVGFEIVLAVTCFSAAVKHFQVLGEIGNGKTMLTGYSGTMCPVSDLSGHGLGDLNCANMDWIKRGEGFCYRRCKDNMAVYDHRIRNNILFCGDSGWTPTTATLIHTTECGVAGGVTSRLLMALVTPTPSPTPSPTPTPSSTPVGMANDLW